MRKFVAILLIAGLLIAGAPMVASAQVDLKHKILVHVVENNTAAPVTAAVATTTIVPGYHQIIGWSVTLTRPASSNDGRIALYDSTSTGATTTSLFAEAEADATYTKTLSTWYPMPKDISTGLVIAQGSYTVVTIYYVYNYGA